MLKDKLNKFLNGDLNFDAFQKAGTDTEFIDSYKKVIKQSKAQTQKFNPFEKIELHRKKRFIIARRLLPYAASVLVLVSFFFVFQKYNPAEKEITINEQEMAELQQNTELALLLFSKELNSCLAKFGDAKKMQQSISEMKSLKDININTNNPLINFKIK